MKTGGLVTDQQTGASCARFVHHLPSFGDTSRFLVGTKSMLAPLFLESLGYTALTRTGRAHGSMTRVLRHSHRCYGARALNSRALRVCAFTRKTTGVVRLHFRANIILRASLRGKNTHQYILMYRDDSSPCVGLGLPVHKAVFLIGETASVITNRPQLSFSKF